MSLQAVSAKLKDGDPVETKYDYGDNLKEAVDKFGEEAVYNRFRAAIVIDLQGYIRSMLRKEPPSSEAEIVTAVAEWQPGVKAKGRTPAERIQELMARLSDDEKSDLLSQFMDE